MAEIRIRHLFRLKVELMKKVQSLNSFGTRISIIVSIVITYKIYEFKLIVFKQFQVLYHFFLSIKISKFFQVHLLHKF